MYTLHSKLVLQMWCNQQMFWVPPPHNQKISAEPPGWRALSAKQRPPLSPAHKPLMTPRPLARSLHGQPVA